MRKLALLAFVPVALVACGVQPSRPPAQPVEVPARAPVVTSASLEICAGASTFLRSLARPVRIEVFASRGLPALDAWADGLDRLLAEYRRLSNGKLDYVMLDPRDASVKEKAVEAGLLATTFGEGGSADKASLVRGFMGLTITYGNEREVIKLLSPDRPTGVEFLIVDKLGEVRDRADGNRHRIGVLVGHGEPRFSDARLVPKSAGKASLAGVLTEHFPRYQLVDVDLNGGQAAVDPTLAVLFVLQPARDWSDRELARIDEAVLAGQSVVFATSAVNVKSDDPTMQATLGRHRLDKLLSGYGFELHEDAVIEYGRPFRVEVETASGNPATLRLPAIPLAVDDDQFADAETQLDAQHPAFFRLTELTFPFASSLAVNPAAQPGVRYRVLARSTPRAQVARAREQSLDVLRPYTPTSSGFGQHVLAAAAEGSIKSAFGPSKSKKRAQVLVIASASFFANPLVIEGAKNDDVVSQLAAVYAQKSVTNQILAFKNTLDWMTLDHDVATCALTPLPASAPSKR